jgi:hypothetical protein
MSFPSQIGVGLCKKSKDVSVFLNSILHIACGLINMHRIQKFTKQNNILVKIQFFAYLPIFISQIQENLSRVQKDFTFNAASCLK